MRVAIVTFDGFNEIDSLVAAHIINRVAVPGWKAEITAPTTTVTSMNGVCLVAQQPLEFVAEADAVVLGSGRRTREVIANAALLARMRIDPARQYVASQCSGALVLIRLGLIREGPVCTDSKTRPEVEAAGFDVPARPFHARGRVATAGGCLASHYLATWLIWQGAGREAAAAALAYVLPRGEEDAYLARALAVVAPHVSDQRAFSQTQPT
jgi:transcriptional regulator GlxA family with amidase domain